MAVTAINLQRTLIPYAVRDVTDSWQKSTRTREVEHSTFVIYNINMIDRFSIVSCFRFCRCVAVPRTVCYRCLR